MLKIFGVPVSQPVRAVVWPCLINKVPFQFCPAAPGTKTRTAEFRRMNPAAQIPAIDDAGFKLGESMAILGAFSAGECLRATWRILTKAASNKLSSIFGRDAPLVGSVADTRAGTGTGKHVLALPPPHDPRGVCALPGAPLHRIEEHHARRRAASPENARKWPRRSRTLLPV